MAAPRFSILLPTTSYGDYLPVTLRSVDRAVAGSDDCELIVVLDGAGRAAPLPTVGRRTVSLVSPGTGISAALNAGLQAAGGDYLVRMDADDLCHPQRFRDLRRRSAGRPDIIAGAIVKFGACRPSYEAPPRDARQAMEDLLHRGYAFAHPAAAVRREALERAGGYDPARDGLEDLDLWLRLLDGGAGFASSRLPHVFYRVHAEQVSRGAAVAAGVRDRLALVPAAGAACGDRCPGRLATCCSLHAGDPGRVCGRYLHHLAVRELRGARGAGRVRRRRAIVRHGIASAGRRLRAGWELARAGGDRPWTSA